LKYHYLVNIKYPEKFEDTKVVIRNRK